MKEVEQNKVPESCRGCEYCQKAVLKHVSLGICFGIVKFTKENSKFIDDIDERPDWCPLEV